MKELLLDLGFYDVVDKEGNVLVMPDEFNFWSIIKCSPHEEKRCIEYNQGTKKVYLPMLSEFVMTSYRDENYESITLHPLGASIVKYTNFITQPLTKGTFVPCDEEGNVLEEPVRHEDVEEYANTTCEIERNGKEWDMYQQAKERVLFEVVYTEQSQMSFWLWLEKQKEPMPYEIIEQAINNGIKIYLI